MPDTTRTSVSERISNDIDKAVDAMLHAAWDLTVKGVRAAAAHPKELAPLAVTALIATAGENAPGIPYGWPLIIVAVAVAGIVLYMRHAHAHPGTASTARRAYYALMYGAAAVWLTLAATAGPTAPLTLETLAAAGAAANGAWWARHLRHRAPRNQETPETPPAPADGDHAETAARIRTWWEQLAAPHTGFAPASRIDGEIRCDEIAAAFDVQLGPRTTYDQFAGAHLKIAAAHKTTRLNVRITRPADQREDRAHVRILHRTLVQDDVPFPGPTLTLETGRAVIGRCDDGRPALLQYWNPGSGPVHEIIAGTSDAGKSRCLDQSLINERHALDAKGRHLVVTWICDPQEGQSLPDWQDAVDEFARTPEESLDLLERAHQEMLRRNRQLAALRWTDKHGNHRTGVGNHDQAFLDTVGLYMPVLSVTIEEAPALLTSPRFKYLVEQILKMGRKCGIRLRLVAQVPSIAELGNSFTIRPLLASMAVVCLRTSEPISAGAFPDLPGNPRDLPKVFPGPERKRTYGLGFILGAEEGALFRTFALDDFAAYDGAHSGTTAHLPDDAAPAPADREPQDAQPRPPQPAYSPAAAAAGPARELISAYLTQHPGHVTSGVLVRDLGLNNSTVSKALAGMVDAGEAVRIVHGVYAAPGTDPGMWRTDAAQAA